MKNILFQIKISVIAFFVTIGLSVNANAGVCSDGFGGFDAFSTCTQDSDCTPYAPIYTICDTSGDGGGGPGGPSNTPPTLANKTIDMGTISAGDVYTFNFNDFGYYDPEEVTPVKLYVDLENTTAGSGTLFIDADSDDVVDNGEAITISSLLAATNILSAVNDGTLKFLPSTGNAYEFGPRANDGTDNDESFATIQITFTLAVNTAPTISSNNGDDAVALNVAENSTAVTTVSATDTDDITYSISGGADANKFSINSSTGVLTFKTAPDFESPNDAGENNTYEVEVTAEDEGSLTDTQTITVTVTNVHENSAPTISGSPLTSINIGQNYSFTPTASDADGDTLVFSIANAPSWSSFDTESGELKGKPALEDTGTFENIVISVSDGEASDALSAFSVEVNEITCSSGNALSESYECTPCAAGSYEKDGECLVCPKGSTSETGATECTVYDKDLDDINDTLDNCPNTANSSQIDTNGDGIGNVCNDAPFSKDFTFVTIKNITKAFKLDDIHVKDEMNISTNTDKFGIHITTLETKGDLKYYNTAVSVNQFIALDKLKFLTYTPEEEEHGSPYATFDFTLSDLEDNSSFEYTATINVINMGILDSKHTYAWNDKISWISLKEEEIQIEVYEDHIEGYIWSDVIGWIDLGSEHSQKEEHTYLNTTNKNWGLNYDNSGNITGYAWNDKIGWIEFNSTKSQVTIDNNTGYFSGYAWNDKIGWISFTGENYKVKLQTVDSDTDENSEEEKLDKVETGSTVVGFTQETKSDGTEETTVTMENKDGKQTTASIKSQVPTTTTETSDGIEKKSTSTDEDGTQTDVTVQVNNNGTTSGDITSTNEDGNEETTKIGSTKPGTDVEIVEGGVALTYKEDNTKVSATAKNGKTSSSVAVTDSNGNTVETKANSEMPGSSVVITEDGGVKTTAKTDDGVSLSAKANPDGSATHQVSLMNDAGETVSSKSTSAIPGATTTINKNGIVATESSVKNTNNNGEEVEIRAVTSTSPDGTTVTRFESVNVATGASKELNPTVDPSTPLEPGNTVNVTENDGNMYIDINTQVTTKIIF